jgi:uncharacterized protein YegJ (DUF2314 family)
MFAGKTPFIALIGLLTASPLAAQTVLEKAARDEIATVSASDPAMAAAIRKAQSTLADFLKLAAAPKPGTDNFSLKVAVHEGESVEYFWIAPFIDSGGQFSGEINNTPRVVHSVKEGQTITFAQSDIVDWLYIENGMMKGNYTACALLKSAPKREAEEFKKTFGLNCDL